MILKNRFHKYILIILAGLLLIISSCKDSIDYSSLSNTELFVAAEKVLLHRIDESIKQLRNLEFPMLGDNTSGQWTAYESPKWTGGFWVGMLWTAYEQTKSEQYLKAAIAWNDAILGWEKENNHDRGFVYFYSSVKAWKNTGKQRYFDSGITAARALVDQQVSGSGVIPQNAKDKTNVIIDTMLNLQLLFWAYNNSDTSDSYHDKYKMVALSQADQTLKEFFKSDGSTFQSVHFDTVDASIIKKHTHQGFTDSSCWSRGQSWAAYGFMKMYEETKNPVYLEYSQKAADYIINKLGENATPWYDYDDPGKYYDSSAGTIAASAFLQLSELLDDAIKSKKYKEYGTQLTRAIILKHLTPFNGSEAEEGILQNGCYQHFKVADSETIWGDYYLMEALSLLNAKEGNINEN